MRKTSGLHNPFAAVYHSSEGTLAGGMAVLDGPREASWHLFNPKRGSMLQHYPLNILAWHARGYNRESIGVENEGFAGQALTSSQVLHLQSLSLWLVEERWLDGLTRGGTTQTLWEHNEVGVNQNPPYGTACPSNRIPWDKIIKEKEEMGLVILYLKDEPHGTYWLSDWMVKRPMLSHAELAFYRYVKTPEVTLEQEMLDTIPRQVTLAHLDSLALGANAAAPMRVTGTFVGDLE